MTYGYEAGIDLLHGLPEASSTNNPSFPLPGKSGGLETVIDTAGVQAWWGGLRRRWVMRRCAQGGGPIASAER